MQIKPFLTVQPSLFWRFLGFFQRPFMRILHVTILVLVIVQLVDSQFMSIRALSNFISEPLGASLSLLPKPLRESLGLLHISVGLTTLVLTLLMIYSSLTNRGLRHFFPYLWKDMTQLRQDLTDSLHFKLVSPRPKGLGAVVQGLGLGALLLAVLSGGLWFLLWLQDSSYATDIRWIHKQVVVLVGLYLFGHGGMALLHFAVWQRKVIWKKQTI